MKTRTLTQEQYERLQPLVPKLRRAVNGGEVVGLTSTIIRGTLFPVYKELFDDAPGNVYCAACVIRVCKRLGELCIDYEAREDAKQPVSAPQTAEVDKTPVEDKKAPQKAKNTPKKKTTKK